MSKEMYVRSLTLLIDLANQDLMVMFSGYDSGKADREEGKPPEAHLDATQIEEWMEEWGRERARVLAGFPEEVCELITRRAHKIAAKEFEAWVKEQP